MQCGGGSGEASRSGCDRPKIPVSPSSSPPLTWWLGLRVNERTVFRTHGLTTLLQEAGLLTQEQIDAGLVRQRETGRRIGETLVEMGAVTEEDMSWALARQLGLPFVDIQLESLDAELIRSFPDGLLHRLEVVPLVRMDRSLTIALSDPTDGDLIDTLEKAAHCRVNPGVATRSAIRAALTTVLGPPRESRSGAEESPHVFDVTWDRSGAAFLLFHLSRALKNGADEIQFLPGPGELRVFYRVRGVLAEAAVVPPEMTWSLLTRISALGGPDIDDRETHVAGQLVCPGGHEEFLVDVSLLNHPHGVAVTLGLRRWNSRPPGIDELGLEALDVARLREALADPAGLIVVTGPPRSGCSTTLSSLLSACSLEGRRALVVEAHQGPVWSESSHVRLTPERATAQWESMVLGQNADVVVLNHVLLGTQVEGLLGSTASGRFVLASTDWIETFSMLEFLMARPDRRVPLASRLRAVVQQRRVPCGVPGEAGSRSRALFEVLHVTEPIRQLLRDGGPADRLRAAALGDGLTPMAAQLRSLVASGAVSPRDARRVET